ncbi:MULTISPECIES: ABC transporter ATP-binding protein [unclassified Alteromonas]|uniref:ABC transporter ATP-binding protein n=1 Tax=unclassified Alteromonas TaxID=2614992 RepID=UPI000509B9C9|nr:MULTISPECIES: ABC transporter ATP-binding protein [unclassified Alteromonas]
MPELIQFKSLDFVYPHSTVPALSGVNMTISEGDYVAIVGTSGSGKSTLLSILGLINEPTSGKYLLLDTNVTDLTQQSVAKLKNAEIGLIFQNFNLLGHLTVYQNVCLPLTYNASVSRKEYREKVVSVLKLVGMEDYLKRYPRELSGGQQQRIAIARAMVNDPSLILADEPTGNLDTSNAEIIFDILESLNKAGKTICLITHDIQFAKRAKVQYTIQDGKLTHAKSDVGNA